jgi:hypothetical protein
MENFCNYSIVFNIRISNFPIRPNDQIINVNGHPVIRHMEHTALKLIRESTDFVNLVIEIF